MKGIIKLYATISGISPIDQTAVKIKLDVSKGEQRVNETKSYKAFDSKTNALLTKKEITLTYQGPARLNHKDDEEFAFTTTDVHNMYGIGANISDLFNGNEVEVYIRWQTQTDASDNMHLIIKDIIIFSTTPQPTELSQILPTLIFSSK